MKSLFLAPLGMQPAAAVAPLLGLGLRTGDEIVILTTPAVEASGSHVRVESLLRERLPGVLVSHEPIEGAGPREVDRSRPERVVLVANGGQAVEVHAVVDRLVMLDGPPTVEIAMSLGTRGLRFDLAGSPIADFVVGDVGLDPLLELLGLERVAQGTVLRRKGVAARSIEVESLFERAGELYACVKIDPRPPGIPKEVNQARLAAYRRLLDWESMQRDLGLEKRRLLLVTESETAFPGDDWPRRLQKRGRRDGIPVVGHVVRGRPLDPERWRRMVAEGVASDIPQNVQGAIAAPPAVTNGSGSWQGPPLVVIAGPQPGATIRTLWAHKPASATILYDPMSADVCDVVRRIAALVPQIGVGRVAFLAKDRLAECPRLPGTHVHTTAGDKITKMRLVLWAARGGEPALLRCTLDGTSASCGASSEDHLSLETWLATQSSLRGKPALRFSATHPAPPERLAVCLEAGRRVHAVLAAGGRLGDQGDAPHGTLNGLPSVGLAVRSAGFWLEDVVAHLLAAACDEVLAGVEFERDGVATTDDEIDIFTSLAGCYTYWSCKTFSKASKVAKAIREARAQATVFLGRMELAVVVVPRLGVPPDGCTGGDGWWRFDSHAWAVDLSFVSDPAKVAFLAGTRPSGPRGPNRWNPLLEGAR